MISMAAISRVLLAAAKLEGGWKTAACARSDDVGYAAAVCCIFGGELPWWSANCCADVCAAVIWCCILASLSCKCCMLSCCSAMAVRREPRAVLRRLRALRCQLGEAGRFAVGNDR